MRWRKKANAGYSNELVTAVGSWGSIQLGTSGRIWRTCFSIPIPGARRLVFSFSNSDLSLGEGLRIAALTPSVTGLSYVEAGYTPATRDIPQAETQVLAVGQY